jgi:hypothetical protein
MMSDTTATYASTLDPQVLDTIINEAGPDVDGQRAVASVIVNRAKSAGMSPRDVVSAPNQFAGYRPSNVDPSSPYYQQVAANTGPILNGVDNPTTDATHFYSGSAPAWAVGRSAQNIGGNKFLKIGYSPKGSAPSQGAADVDDSQMDQSLLGPDNSKVDDSQMDQNLLGPDNSRAVVQDTSTASAAPRFAVIGDHGLLINPDTKQPFADPIQKTYRSMIAGMDPSAPKGSANYPYVAATMADIDHTPDGAYYIGPDGEYAQKGAPNGLNIARQDEMRNQSMSAERDIPFLGSLDAGATAPFSDELEGLIGYGGQAVYNAYARAAGQPVNVSASQRAQAATEVARLIQANRDKSAPIFSTTGRVLSGFALGPEGGLPGAAARSLGLAAPQAAVPLVKALVPIAASGAANDYLDSNPDPGAPILNQIGSRSIAGGLGAAGALATAGGLGVASKLVGPRVVTPIADAVTGGVNRLTGGNWFPRAIPGADPRVAQQAADYVAKLAMGSGTSPADLAASSAPTAAEALGSSGINATAALARRTGTTGDAADDLFLTRQAGRPQRIVDGFASATGVSPAVASGNIDSVVQAGQARAAPLYKAALSPQHGVWNPDLAEAVSARPQLRQSLTDAITDVRNSGRPSTQPVVLAPQPGQSIQVVQAPTPETWDLAKKYLGQTVERDPLTNRVITSGQAGVTNRYIDQASSHLTGLLRDAIPGYGQALDAAGDYLRVQKAYDNTGGLLFDRQTPASDFHNYFSRLSPAEQEGAKASMANDIYNRAQNGQTRLKDMLTPNASQKLQIAFGPEAASNISAMLDRENAMQLAERKVPTGAGSPTMGLRAAQEEQDGGINLGRLATDVAADAVLTGHPGVGLLSAGLGLLKKPVEMSVAARNLAGDTLLGSPQQAYDLLNKVAPSSTKIPYGLFGSLFNTLENKTGAYGSPENPTPGYR